MTQAGAEWQYVLVGEPLDDDHRGQALIRFPPGEPVSLAQAVTADGEWELTDLLWKNRYEGADEPVHPIGVEDAATLLARWVAAGRVATLPSSAPNIPPELAERMRAADRQARAVWSRVEMPPGADQITF